MDKKIITKGIVSLISRFYSDGNSTVSALLRATGYFEFFNEVNERDIYDCLVKYPECVDQWISWSEDKRTDSGWYIHSINNHAYEVGYFSSFNKSEKSNKYSDRTEACSVFIKREIESIRTLYNVSFS